MPWAMYNCVCGCIEVETVHLDFAKSQNTAFGEIVKVSSERIPDSQIVLNIEVDDDEFEAHKNRAYKKIVQQANVPGFRKGKAPRQVLEQVLRPRALVE